MHSRFSQKWLSTLSGILPGTKAASFLVPANDEQGLHVQAVWPEGTECSQEFLGVAKYAIKKNGEVCIPGATKQGDHHYDYYAQPIHTEDAMLGMLIIKMNHLPKAKRPAVFRAFRHSIKWMELANYTDPESDKFYQHTVDILACCFDAKDYESTLLELVTHLTQYFGCERVAYSEVRGMHNEVVSISNSAEFNSSSTLIQRIADAMDEACEQDQAILFPSSEEGGILRAHQELVRKFGYRSVLTVPLVNGHETMGAITLLDNSEVPFDQETLDLCLQTFSLLAPILHLKRAEERHIAFKVAQSARKGFRATFGIDYLQTKVLLFVIVVALGIVSFGKGEFYLVSDAILEGEVQRVVAAPTDGYLLASYARAGDFIEDGQVLAQLDDKELLLEMSRLKGSEGKLRREYREAQSLRELVDVRVLREQLNQIEAEMELVQQKLDNISMAAPFDGIVIEGDLSERLGSPVVRGDSLFTVAPLEGYRIILKVDETEISYVKEGQVGWLTLASFSRTRYPILVKKITSVAKADNGKNIFKVEATLPNPPKLLRPGMIGVGKIYTGEQRLIWIWTREIVDWLRLWWWSW